MRSASETKWTSSSLRGKSLSELLDAASVGPDSLANGGMQVRRCPAEPIGTDDPEASNLPYGRKEGCSAVQYLEAIRSMQDRLDTLLAQPSEQWPQSEVFLQLKQIEPK